MAQFEVFNNAVWIEVASENVAELSKKKRL